MADKKKDADKSEVEDKDSVAEELENKDEVTPEVEDAPESADDTAMTDETKASDAEAEPETLEEAKDEVTEPEPTEPEPERPEPEPEPVQAAPEPARQPKPQKRSAWPMVIAGVVLAGLGFVAGRGDLVNDYLPEAWQTPDIQAEVTKVFEERLAEEKAALEAEIAALQTQLQELPPPADLTPVTSSVDALGGRVEALEALPDRLSALEGLPDQVAALEALPERIVALEDRPIVLPNEDTTDFTAAFTAMQEQAQSQAETFTQEFSALQEKSAAQTEQIATLLAEAEETRTSFEAEYDAQATQIQTLLEQQAAAEAEAAAAQAAAEEAARLTLARAAMGKIQAAIDAGEPFADAIAEFSETGYADVPEALAAVAADGVSPLGNLQLAAAGAARDALAAARNAAGGVQGVAGFLEKRLGVRSLEPQEGDSPDAVLSRVVAQIENGALAEALAEAESLPDTAKAAMADWLAQAQARSSAVEAAGVLAGSLPTN